MTTRTTTAEPSATISTFLLALGFAVVLSNTARAADFRSDDTSAQAVVADAFAEQIAESRAAGAEDAALTVRVDLDEDGTDDLLGMVSSGYLCAGASGCPIGVFKGALNGRFTYLTFVTAEVLEVLDSKTNGMRDLNLGSQSGMRKVRWNGTAYE